MINKIITYILSAILMATLGYGIFLYVENQKLKKELYDTENELFVKEQNISALKEREKMKADSIQQYSVEVSNLKSLNDKILKDSEYWYTEHQKLLNKYSDLKDSYVILITNFTLLKDSIFAKNSTIPAIVGDLIIVPFSGKESNIYYNGKTTFNVQDSTGNYEISIIRDPIDIQNNIRILELPNEKKLVSEIYANGILINNAKTIIDSSVYILLRRGLPEINELGFWDKLKVGGGISFYNPDITQVSYVDQYKLNMYLKIEYNFNNTISVYVDKTLFDKTFSIGGQYLVPVKRIFK